MANPHIEIIMTTKERAIQEYFGNLDLPPTHAARVAFDSGYNYGLKKGEQDAKAHNYAEGLRDGVEQVRGNLSLYEGAEILVSDPGYEKLVEVLELAHNHAARGKGKERHACDLPFDRQRMLSITRELKSPRGLAYQVIKKISEGLDLPTYSQQLGELLGAINYTAGIVIYLQELEAAKPVPPATDAYSQLAEDLKDVSFQQVNRMKTTSEILADLSEDELARVRSFLLVSRDTVGGA